MKKNENVIRGFINEDGTASYSYELDTFFNGIYLNRPSEEQIYLNKREVEGLMKVFEEWKLRVEKEEKVREIKRDYNKKLAQNEKEKIDNEFVEVGISG